MQPRRLAARGIETGALVGDMTQTQLHHAYMATMFQERIYDALDAGSSPLSAEISALKAEMHKHMGYLPAKR